jgi:hypothetical protein
LQHRIATRQGGDSEVSKINGGGRGMGEAKKKARGWKREKELAHKREQKL